jgi:hypothetical protein
MSSAPAPPHVGAFFFLEARRTCNKAASTDCERISGPPIHRWHRWCRRNDRGNRGSREKCRDRSRRLSSCPDHRQIRVRLRAAVLHWTQQLRIDAGQPRQGLRIQQIVFAPALPNPTHARGRGGNCFRASCPVYLACYFELGERA